MAPNPASASAVPYRLPGVAEERVCSQAIGCASGELVEAAALLVVATGTMLALVALAHLQDARDALEEERTRTRDERDALRRFARRVSRIGAPSADRSTSANAAGPSEGNAGALALRSSGSDGRCRRIADAYRETVMAVPHYDEEYGDTLVESMSGELSREVAASVTGEGSFTPQLKRAVVEQSRRAAERRDALLDSLDDEEASLSEATDALADCERSVERYESARLLRYPFDDLLDGWERLGDHRETCREVISDRQRTLHDEIPSVRPDIDGMSFRQYLYQDLDVDYPVLADAACLLDRIEAVERTLVDVISRRT